MKGVEHLSCEETLGELGLLSLAQAAQRGCGISSLEILKNLLDVVLGSLWWVFLLGQELGQMGLIQSYPTKFLRFT